jgi:hypothetical protein
MEAGSTAETVLVKELSTLSEKGTCHENFFYPRSMVVGSSSTKKNWGISS